MAMALCTARVFGSSVSATARTGIKSESVFSVPCRWASKKAGGSTKNGRDSESKRLGVKKFGGYVHTCIFMLFDGLSSLVDIGRTAHVPAVTIAYGNESIRRQSVVAGNIIIRQRGTKYHAGTGVGIGKDHTIFATRDGFVRFWYNTPKKHQEVSVKSHREVQRAGVKSST